MPRVAACYCVYDDIHWLEPSLSSIYAAVDAIYVLVSSRPWCGTGGSNTATLDFIASYPDSAGRIRLKTGHWPTEVDQRNSALDILAAEGFDYMFIIDADEVYERRVVPAMFEYCFSRPDVGSWHCWFVTYWKSVGFRIDPPEQHHPPVLLRVGSGRFLEYRNCLCQSMELVPPKVAYCNHLSYVRPDAWLRRKLETFSHSTQVVPGWYERVWKGWDANPAMEDLHPCNPPAFKRAVPVPPDLLPYDLKRYL